MNESSIRGKSISLWTYSNLPGDREDFSFKNHDLVKDYFQCFKYFINKHINEKDLKTMYFVILEGYRGHVSNTCVFYDSMRPKSELISLHLELINTEDSILRYVSRFDSLNMESFVLHPLSFKTLKLFRNSSTLIIKIMDNENGNKMSLRKMRKYNKRLKRLKINVKIDESNEYKSQK